MDKTTEDERKKAQKKALEDEKAKAAVEEDEDDEEEDEDEEDEDEEDEDEDESVSPAASPRARRHASHDAHGHDHDHDEDDDDDGPEDDESDLDDPYWWTPHAVLSALVLVGVLGFFGVFNGPLARLSANVGTTTTEEQKPKSQPKEKEASDQPATYGAKHLLVMYKGSMRAPESITRTDEEAKTRAMEAMNKAKARGAKFEDVVKEYSDEPGAAQRGGDLGVFRKGQMVGEFQTAVEKLKVGEVSGLVKTPFGYHVILRTK